MHSMSVTFQKIVFKFLCTLFLFLNSSNFSFLPLLLPVLALRPRQNVALDFDDTPDLVVSEGPNSGYASDDGGYRESRSRSSFDDIDEVHHLVTVARPGPGPSQAAQSATPSGNLRQESTEAESDDAFLVRHDGDGRTSVVELDGPVDLSERGVTSSTFLNRRPSLVNSNTDPLPTVGPVVGGSDSGLRRRNSAPAGSESTESEENFFPGPDPLGASTIQGGNYYSNEPPPLAVSFKSLYGLGLSQGSLSRRENSSSASGGFQRASSSSNPNLISTSGLGVSGMGPDAGPVLLLNRSDNSISSAESDIDPNSNLNKRPSKSTEMAHKCLLGCCINIAGASAGTLCEAILKACPCTTDLAAVDFFDQETPAIPLQLGMRDFHVELAGREFDCPNMIGESCCSRAGALCGFLSCMYFYCSGLSENKQFRGFLRGFGRRVMEERLGINDIDYKGVRGGWCGTSEDGCCNKVMQASACLRSCCPCFLPKSLVLPLDAQEVLDILKELREAEDTLKGGEIQNNRLFDRLSLAQVTNDTAAETGTVTHHNQRDQDIAEPSGSNLISEAASRVETSPLQHSMESIPLHDTATHSEGTNESGPVRIVTAPTGYGSSNLPHSVVSLTNTAVLQNLVLHFEILDTYFSSFLRHLGTPSIEKNSYTRLADTYVLATVLVGGTLANPGPLNVCGCLAVGAPALSRVSDGAILSEDDATKLAGIGVSPGKPEGGIAAAVALLVIIKERLDPNNKVRMWLERKLSEKVKTGDGVKNALGVLQRRIKGSRLFNWYHTSKLCGKRAAKSSTSTSKTVTTDSSNPNLESGYHPCDSDLESGGFRDPGPGITIEESSDDSDDDNDSLSLTSLGGVPGPRFNTGHLAGMTRRRAKASNRSRFKGLRAGRLTGQRRREENQMPAETRLSPTGGASSVPYERLRQRSVSSTTDYDPESLSALLTPGQASESSQRTPGPVQYSSLNTHNDTSILLDNQANQYPPTSEYPRPPRRFTAIYDSEVLACSKEKLSVLLWSLEIFYIPIWKIYASNTAGINYSNLNSGLFQQSLETAAAAKTWLKSLREIDQFLLNVVTVVGVGLSEQRWLMSKIGERLTEISSNAVSSTSEGSSSGSVKPAETVTKQDIDCWIQGSESALQSLTNISDLRVHIITSNSQQQLQSDQTVQQKKTSDSGFLKPTCNITMVGSPAAENFASMTSKCNITIVPDSAAVPDNLVNPLGVTPTTPPSHTTPIPTPKSSASNRTPPPMAHLLSSPSPADNAISYFEQVSVPRRQLIRDLIALDTTNVNALISNNSSLRGVNSSVSPSSDNDLSRPFLHLDVKSLFPVLQLAAASSASGGGAQAFLDFVQEEGADFVKTEVGNLKKVGGLGQVVFEGFQKQDFGAWSLRWGERDDLDEWGTLVEEVDALIKSSNLEGGEGSLRGSGTNVRE